ncbi:MAG: glutamate--tRNA ligase [Clostridia bacterium]|nr:glutamate--tRNA ligase [Clostridia bacterium]
MTNKELADLMFPNVTKTIEDYEKEYPERNLPEGAVVSRYAPSPTGFVHMGNMLSCFIENKLPQQTKGVFYLRIEDTDQKREVESGIENIVNAINMLGLTYHEGVMGTDVQKGDYGPYIQSHRKEIYDTFAKYLIENGMAYPCFCNAEELEATREKQKNTKARIGYYGQYAKCRNIDNEERARRIKEGQPYTIRLKSTGNYNRKIVFKDLVKGKVSFPENDQDMVLIKSDGIPVYHFAHVVDDHLMRTTHVLRGEDWLSSVPVHIELFQKFGFKLPQYAHLGLIMIIDSNGVKRKISKRKDQDFTVESFHRRGFPTVALQEYLMTIANSNFEGWRMANPDKSLDEFEFSFSKVGSCPLFDTAKLINISKNCISKMKASDLYDNLLNWANEYDKDFYDVLVKDKDLSIAVLNIEREQKKPRKDYACYSDIKTHTWYMFEEYFGTYEKQYEWSNINDINEIKLILNDYIDNYYSAEDDKDTWFDKMKQLSKKYGYAESIKEYKESPDNFKGNITDIATVIRVAVTTRSMTPDLYEILKILGKDKIKERIQLL